MIDFSRHRFSPVIHLPANYEVYDFSAGYDPRRERSSDYGVGKYNEVRKNMYTTALFGNERNIHMGIDLAAPVGEPVHSFYDGVIFSFAYNAAAGDYGHTVIVHHRIDGVDLYALYGHLSGASTANKRVGQDVRSGEIIAWVGDEHENGGWNPHLHLQLSYEKPLVCDMPGAVSAANRAKALLTYPDPQLVLGKLY
jgi:murein DD-endopeptidase MepM/ murein hydrolase activator NlpD